MFVWSARRHPYLFPAGSGPLQSAIIHDLLGVKGGRGGRVDEWLSHVLSGRPSAQGAGGMVKAAG